MPKASILLALPDASLCGMLERGALVPAGYEVATVADAAGLDLILKGSPPDLIILAEAWQDGAGIQVGSRLRERLPAVPLILVASDPSPERLLECLRAGFADCWFPPLRTAEVVSAVQRVLDGKRKAQEALLAEARKRHSALQKRLNALEVLQRVGRTVTSLLDLDAILTTVVDAAVELTGAEEGSLLLLDEASGELTMRAARNFQEDFVRKFRLPFRDSLAGQVMRTGKPIFINETTPQKIKTSYLVHTLIYYPLQVHGRVIGVLGVDNRHGGHPFLEDHMEMIAALADYGAIAIENARVYAQAVQERNKLETILTGVEDGVIVIDTEGRLVIANHTARAAFNLESDRLLGKPAQDVLRHPDLLEMIRQRQSHAIRTEIAAEDGRIFNAQSTPIPEVGLAITMQDITHLKELDRIKSDFVHTVSHDLRSPLTAILGYVELIDRVGPLTEAQRDFVQRVQMSVHNITALINDLLELGRIEAGFDARKEVVYLDSLIRLCVEEVHASLVERNMELTLDLQAKTPALIGDPIRLKQLVLQLMGNAIKYTPSGGTIRVTLQHEAGQLIFRVSDNGPGIPASEQPYIFDKFYRGSNVAFDTSGSGLGLAIVKSIVENHQGRIWVESAAGKGTTFIVMLPVTDQAL